MSIESKTGRIVSRQSTLKVNIWTICAPFLSIMEHLRNQIDLSLQLNNSTHQKRTGIVSNKREAMEIMSKESVIPIDCDYH